MEKEKRIEIQDMDSYEPESETVYSHQSLIMKGMKRVYDLGGLELHEGCDVKEIFDNKPIVIHKPDERQQYINAIKQVKSGIICDFDETIIKSLKELEEGLEKKRKDLLKSQFEAWNSLDVNQKSLIGVPVIYNNLLHPNLPYLREYKDLELEYYRKVFEAIILLTKRKNFYSQDMVTG